MTPILSVETNGKNDKQEINPTKSILIVDDNKLICDNIKSKLTRLGYAQEYNILTALNSTEAEIAFDKYLPDIVITDIHMPSVSGLALIEKLSKREHKADVFVLSGFDDYNYVRKAFLLGVTDYMLKPVDIDELDQKLKKSASGEATEIKPEDFAKDSSIEGVMRQAVEYIDENIVRAISMRDVAEHVGISYSYFSKLFKESTGKHFAEYFHIRRIELSKKYLYDPSFKIQDIARKAGYETPSEFSRAFKKYVGCYPTEYKQEKQ